MQFIVILFAALAIFTAMTSSTQRANIDSPAAVSSARAQLDQYRLFMYVASQYMHNYSGGARTITWQTLRSVPYLPSGARNGTMPGSWKVVAAADNTWVACTDLDERTIGALEQLVVQGGQGLKQTTLTGQSYVVVGQTEDLGKASQCS